LVEKEKISYPSPIAGEYNSDLWVSRAEHHLFTNGCFYKFNLPNDCFVTCLPIVPKL
jgi:hypothetical protein